MPIHEAAVNPVFLYQIFNDVSLPMGEPLPIYEAAAVDLGESVLPAGDLFSPFALGDTVYAAMADLVGLVPAGYEALAWLVASLFLLYLVSTAFSVLYAVLSWVGRK